MENLVIGGKNYISSKRAAEIMGYTQDYVGQLARSGKISAERISGVWYINEDEFSKLSKGTKKESGLTNNLLNQNLIEKTNKINTKEGYKKQSKTVENENNITLSGVDYISSKRAAEIMGYTQDYVGQLARSGKISAERISGVWYIPKSVAYKNRKLVENKQGTSHKEFPVDTVILKENKENAEISNKPKVFVGLEDIEQQTVKLSTIKVNEEKSVKVQKIESETKYKKKNYYYPSFLNATYHLDNTPLIPLPRRSRESVLHQIVRKRGEAGIYKHNMDIQSASPKITRTLQKQVSIKGYKRVRKVVENYLEPGKRKLIKRSPISLMKLSSVAVSVLLFASITTFIPNISVFSSNTGTLEKVYLLGAPESDEFKAEAITSISKTSLIEVIMGAIVSLFEEEIEYKAE